MGGEPAAVTAGTRAPTPHADAALGDAAIAARIWPLLGASALGLVPFTLYSTALVEITRDAQSDAALMGWLRGTGGVAALVVGLGCAPLLDRVSRGAMAAGALAVIGGACAVAVHGTVWSWTMFCLLVGAATSVLNPAVSAMAADRFADGATAGRAATQVSATMTLTAVLGAPTLARSTRWWGWRGDLLAVVALAALTAVALVRRGAPATAGRSTTAAAGAGTGYGQALRTACRTPGVGALLLVSVLRTTAFMGQLAYLAVLCSERWGAGPGLVSMVWGVSGLSFFLGTWCGGRFLRSVTAADRAAWLAAGAATLGAGSVLVLFVTDHGGVAVVMTVVLGLTHAVVAAVVTTLLVRACPGSRGTVLGLNGAGQSLGVCMGATVAGVGLALGGWPGAGLALAVVSGLCALVAGLAARRLRAGRPLR